MKRCTFLKTTLLGTVGAGFKKYNHQPLKTHILSLSFDDGFRKSFYKIADIFEEFGLSACLNIIASGHLPSFQQVDEWILPKQFEILMTGIPSRLADMKSCLIAGSR